VKALRLALNVNGREVALDAEAGMSLLGLLRDRLGLLGTREGCGKGDCGSCTGARDGRPFSPASCLPFRQAASA